MKVYGRLIAALLVAGGLSGCGVAVDQRTLAPVVAAPSPTAAPAPATEPEPEPEIATPQTASLSEPATNAVTSEGEQEADIVGETEIASLSPSAAKSIDELVAAIPETEPAAPVDPAEPAVVVPTPPAETQDSEEVTPPVTSQKGGEPAAADDGSAVDVVGDIIWNLDAAMKSRPPRRRRRKFRSAPTRHLPAKRSKPPLRCWRGAISAFPMMCS